MESRQNSFINLIHTIMKTIYAFIAVMCLFLATATTDSAVNQILWSGSMMLIAWLSGYAFSKRLTDEEEERV